MDDDDVFVLKSDSESEKDEKCNENIDQNMGKKDNNFAVSKTSKKTKHHRKNHHHHHHRHHHKSKSEINRKSPKVSHSPILQKETFCINNTTNEEDDNFIVNFKFELSDSVESSNRKQQTNLLTPSLGIDHNDLIKTPNKFQSTETPKTEIKASSVSIANILPIENKNIESKTLEKNSEPKTDMKSKLIHEKKEIDVVQRPKKIQLITHKKTTNSLFEYNILSFLDQSLNHLSQDFLEEFQYYVQDAFSYDKALDDFLLSLNSEILDIFHISNNQDEKEIRLIDNVDMITEKVYKDMPHMKKKEKSLSYNEIENIKMADLLEVQEKFLSAHQFFNEMQSNYDENLNNQSDDDEIKSKYTRLKDAQLKRIELESINEIQLERLSCLEEKIQEVQKFNEINMKKKYNSSSEIDSNILLKNSMKNLIEDLQNILPSNNNYSMNNQKFDKFKNSLDYYLANRDKVSYEIECLGNLTVKSFCPLFNQMSSFKPFHYPQSHRRENVASE